jgi:hypothetical protein
VLTLSGNGLNGILSSSVSLAGDLILDLDGVNVYNGMTFVLVNSTSLTGQWDGVIATGISSDCTQVQVDVSYTQQMAIATVSLESLCSRAPSLLCFFSLF